MGTSKLARNLVKWGLIVSMVGSFALADQSRDCFKALTVQDQARLEKIVFLYRDLQSKGYAPQKVTDTIAQEVNSGFTGESREAAVQVLASMNAQDKLLSLDNILLKAVAQGRSLLSHVESQEIESVIREAKRNAIPMAALEIYQGRLLAMNYAYKYLRSQGAVLDSVGAWNFSKFNFKKQRTDIKTVTALQIFFPLQMAKLQGEGTQSAMLGNYVLIKHAAADKDRNGINEIIYQAVELGQTGLSNLDLKKIDILVQKIKSERGVDLSKANFQAAFNDVKSLKDNEKSDEFKRLGRSKVLYRDAAGKLSYVWTALSLKDYTEYSEKVIAGFEKHVRTYIENSRANSQWYQLIKSAFTGDQPYFNAMIEAQKNMSEDYSQLAALGASEEVRASIRWSIANLLTTDDQNIEVGLANLRKALTVTCALPLAYFGAPAIASIFGSVGSTTTALGTAGAYLGVGATVVGIGLPIAMTTRQIYEAVKAGGDLSCNLFKHGLELGLSVAQTLEWGALGPALKQLAPFSGPVVQWLGSSAGKSISTELAEKIVTVVPTIYLVSEGFASELDKVVTSVDAVTNIQILLAAEQKAGRGHEGNIRALKLMLEAAKQKKWESVVNLGNSLVEVIGKATGVHKISFVDIPTEPVSTDFLKGDPIR